MSFSFVDICAGIGGFRIGLEKLGHKCVQSVEIDEDCIKTYNENFSKNIQPKDIFDLKVEEFRDHDILCAGFPCQPFSIAGKRLGRERNLKLNLVLLTINKAKYLKNKLANKLKI